MKPIPLIVFLLGTVLAQAEGFGLKDIQKGFDLVERLVKMGVEIETSFFNKIMPKKMDQLMDGTSGEPTCPEEAANGVYPLKPVHTTIPPFRVYCEEGGWIVIHRRFNGKLNFDRKWHEYRDGFGDIQDEFWLGLEKLHQITRTGSFELMVVLKGFGAVEKWSKFEGFRVAGEFEQYRLDLEKFIAGNAGDSIFWHNGMKFSTSDRDNDPADDNCAQRYRSGWWFKQCYDTNLNGLYGHGESDSRMSWFTFDQNHEGLKAARMMIRRVQDCQQKKEFFGSSLLD